MKKLFPFILAGLALVMGCNNATEAPKAENDVDAVRNFVQASLFGDYENARKYMLRDSANDEKMSLIERVNLSAEEKRGLATSSINMHAISRVNDSTTIVIYSNSFKNDHDTLKVVRQHGEWLVDFKYLFTHGSDTLAAPPPLPKTDSAP